MRSDSAAEKIEGNVTASCGEHGSHSVCSTLQGVVEKGILGQGFALRLQDSRRICTTGDDRVDCMIATCKPSLDFNLAMEVPSVVPCHAGCREDTEQGHPIRYVSQR